MLALLGVEFEIRQTQIVMVQIIDLIVPIVIIEIAYGRDPIVFVMIDSEIVHCRDNTRALAGQQIVQHYYSY